MSDELPIPPAPDPSTQVPPAPDVSNLPATSRPAPNPPLPQQQTQQGPPQLGQPNIVSLISGLIKPPQQVDTSSGFAVSRPASRAEVFERFLGNFLYSMGAGLQASGHGPGAFGRGLGAAITAGPQRDLQQYELGQQQQTQQADIARTQAQTQQIQSMGDIVQTPLGPMSKALAEKILPSYFKGSQAADISAQSKLGVEQLKFMANAGQIAYVRPALDDQGNSTYAAYNKQGQFVRYLDKSVDPGLLQKSTTSGQWLPDGAGGYMLATKTSTSGPVLPGNAQPTGQPSPSGFPKPTGGTSTPVARPAGSTTRPTAGRMLGNTPVIAFDPQTNERVLTTPSEAASKGYTQPVTIKEGDIEKYRSSQNMFNDVQANVSRYRSAAQRFSKEGKPSDAIGINLAINEAKLGGAIHLGPAGIEIPGYSSLAEAADRVARSESYKKLSPAGKDLVDGYFRTMAAVPAYQKALTGIGRSNKEMLDLELANIPNPTMAPADILRKLQAFQENINQGAAGIPRIQGMKSIKDIRAQYETPQVDFTIPSQLAPLTQTLGDQQ